MDTWLGVFQLMGKFSDGHLLSSLAWAFLEMKPSNCCCHEMLSLALDSERLMLNLAEPSQAVHHTKSGIFSWNGRTCHSLALSLLLASSACSSPHIQHTPCWRWRQSLCGVGGLLVLWDMTCANMSCNTVLLTAQPWCGKSVLSASLSSSERAQSLAFLCGVPLAQLIAQADPDTPEVELVYEKTPNYFNLNLKRR